MTTYIADHAGAINIQSRNLRPIHIGAGMCELEARGLEPDTKAANSLSTSHVYADLRLYHHIRNEYAGRASHVAIMQYRRMFFLGKPYFWQKSLKAMNYASLSQSGGEVPIDVKSRDEYLAHLARLSDRVLRNEIGSADFLANEMSFETLNLSVEQQYIDAIKLLYPDQPEYVDAWYDLRSILERMTSRTVVANCLDGHWGYFNNCFVSSWENFVRYYDFLFEALDGLAEYNEVYRLFGYLAERIFGVYVTYSRLRVSSRAILRFA
ncbi:MAG: DUF4422 domain-containing protein [Lentilitoribacter sp.]